MANRLDELHRERGEFKLQGRIREMIPVQHAIIVETEQAGLASDSANAWNYLAALHHQVHEYDMAEQAARKALEVLAGDPTANVETLGCFQFKLAQILAAQRRFADAVPIAEAGIRSFAVYHNPPDDFLTARQNEAAMMREHMERTVEVDELRGGPMAG